MDEYFLILWKKNTAKEAGQKISIANKGTVSFIAEVEACVEYNFVMEYVENDIIRQVWKKYIFWDLGLLYTTTHFRVFMFSRQFFFTYLGC